MADTFRGTVESLLRIEERNETILDFKVRSESKTQRVRARLALAEWLHEGELVQVDGQKDNEGVLVADRVSRVELPQPVEPQLTGRFLIGLSLTALVIYSIAVRSAEESRGGTAVAALWVALGGGLIFAPRKWKLSARRRLLARGYGVTLLVAGVARLTQPSESWIVALGFLILFLLLLGALLYPIGRRIVARLSA